MKRIIHWPEQELERGGGEHLGAASGRAGASLLGRRDFLRLGGLVLLGGGALACGGRPLAAVPDGGGPDGGACLATGADIEGPFHRPQAPFRTMLAAADEPGERLLISGTLYGPDCQGAIADAVVDVWQADTQGHYDNDGSSGTPDPNTFRLRGRMRTDANGRYEYETILPGRYLNGPTYRPRHIHYKVLAPGRAELTTQLYFEGDEFIAGDPWASQSRSIIPLASTGTLLSGTYDIVLA